MEPLHRSRRLSLLEALTASEGWPQHIDDYINQMREYEAQISLHEQANGTRFDDDDVKIAKVVRNVPEEVKTHLLLGVDYVYDAPRTLGGV